MPLIQHLLKFVSENNKHYASIAPIFHIPECVTKIYKGADFLVVEKTKLESKNTALFTQKRKFHWLKEHTGRIMQTIPMPNGNPQQSLVWAVLRSTSPEPTNFERTVESTTTVEELTVLFFKTVFEYFDARNRKYARIGKLKDAIVRRESDRQVVQLICNYLRVSIVVFHARSGDEEEKTWFCSPSHIFCQSVDGVTTFQRRPILFLYRRGDFYQALESADASEKGATLFTDGQAQYVFEQIFKERTKHISGLKKDELQTMALERGISLYKMTVSAKTGRERRVQLKKAELIETLKRF